MLAVILTARRWEACRRIRLFHLTLQFFLSQKSGTVRSEYWSFVYVFRFFVTKIDRIEWNSAKYGKFHQNVIAIPSDNGS